jgi:CHAT domain-containing protein
LMTLGRQAEAIAVLEPFLENMPKSDRASEVRTRHRVFGILAALYSQAGKLDVSMRMLESLYNEQRSRPALRDTGILETLFNLWVVYGQSKRFESEPQLFKSIANTYVRTAEGFRNRLGLSTNDRREIAAKSLGNYRIYAYGLGGGQINGAVLPAAGRDLYQGFEITDLSKGRSLWETVISARALRESGIDSSIIQRVKVQLATISGLEQRSAVLLAVASSPERDKSRAALRQMLALERNNLASLEDRLLKDYPKYAALREFQVPNVKTEAPKLLGKDDLFLSYSLDESGLLFVWLVNSAGAVEFVELGTQTELNQKIADLRALVARGVGSNERLASLKREISAALIQPLRSQLTGKTWLIVSPDSDLAVLPFDILELEGEALAKRFNISVVQSWTIFTLLKQREADYRQLPSSKALFAIGNPQFQPPSLASAISSEKSTEGALRGARIIESSGAPGQPTSPQSVPPWTVEREAELLKNLRWASLPGTGTEIARVSATFPTEAGVTTLTGEQATESNITKLNASGELARYRYLLFSTHGALATDPSLSALVLSHETGGLDPNMDGYLTAIEIERFQLRSELTVLSACETVVGDPLPGEGVLGLPFSLFVAGNLNTLLTLWPISDTATVEFMSRFFKRLSARESQSAALAAVKREFSVHPLYSHPKYWAGFVLNGV